MLSFIFAITLIVASQAGCVWDGTGCFDNGCDQAKREANCGKFDQATCESTQGMDSRCRWTFGSAKPALVRAADIDLEPMRSCGKCWECYACTHDEHYGNAGNCVPVLGCVPSQCETHAQCGEDRTCFNGQCVMNGCSDSTDCGNNQQCYYGECRDRCTHSSQCSAANTGDICEHGLCVCSGDMC